MKKQSIVAKSSAEAEYRAMGMIISEVIWLRWLLKELGATQINPTILHYNSQATLHIASNLVSHKRTKHMEIDCYFMRERMKLNEVK